MVSQWRKPLEPITRNKQSVPIFRSYAKLQFIQNKNDSGNFFRHKFAVQSICNEMNFRHFSRSIVKNSEMLYERWNNAPVI